MSVTFPLSPLRLQQQQPFPPFQPGETTNNDRNCDRRMGQVLRLRNVKQLEHIGHPVLDADDILIYFDNIDIHYTFIIMHSGMHVPVH